MENFEHSLLWGVSISITSVLVPGDVITFTYKMLKTVTRELFKLPKRKTLMTVTEWQPEGPILKELNIKRWEKYIQIPQTKTREETELCDIETNCCHPKHRLKITDKN